MGCGGSKAAAAVEDPKKDEEKKDAAGNKDADAVSQSGSVTSKAPDKEAPSGEPAGDGGEE